jgi:hypothetical protein
VPGAVTGGTGIALTDLSAGTGMSYNNTTGVFTNSAPDQTVAITAGTNITSVIGTYPNFTINAATQAGGITELTATGTINSSNTAFTFLSKPTYIFIDGVKYRENEGWTWAVLTATVTKAPDYSIWGEA